MLVSDSWKVSHSRQKSSLLPSISSSNRHPVGHDGSLLLLWSRLKLRVSRVGPLVVLITLALLALLGIKSILSSWLWTQGYPPLRGLAESTIGSDSLILAPSVADINDARRGLPLEIGVGSYVHSSAPGRASPQVVLVLELDFEHHDPDYLAKLLENRKEYAQKHGYGLYARFPQDFHYQYLQAPRWRDWTRIAICREAMFVFQGAKYFWYLDADSVIVDLEQDVHAKFLKQKPLNKLMLRDHPIIFSSNVIKTTSHQGADSAEFILSQDTDGLDPNSFLFTNSDFSHSLFDYWGDTIHHSYEKWPRAHASALDHLTLWHYHFRKHIALISPRLISSEIGSSRNDLAYAPGDFVARFPNCGLDKANCYQQLDQFFPKPLENLKPLA